MSGNDSRKQLDLVPPDGRIINKSDYPELLADYSEWAGAEFKLPEMRNLFPDQIPSACGVEQGGVVDDGDRKADAVHLSDLGGDEKNEGPSD